MSEMPVEYDAPPRAYITLGEHVLIVGSTGSGKTYFWKHGLSRSFSRSLVVDTKGIDFDDLPPIRRKDPYHVAKAIPHDTRKAFRWRWTPTRTQDVAEMEELSRGLLDRVASLGLYVDEVTDFQSAQYIAPQFRALVQKGRAQAISVIAGTQRPPGVSRWIADNTTHRFFFFIHPQDRHTLEKYWHGISEHLARIRWGSHDYVYVGPDGSMGLHEHI